MKGILEFLAKNNRWAIVMIIILLLISGGVFKFQRNKINEWKNKHEIEVKLKNALIDSVTYYQNAYGDEVAEKLTIQESIKNLEKVYNQLSSSQKELVTRVKKLNKNNTVITAALIEANVKIDSLLIKDGEDGSEVVIDTVNKVVNFNNMEAIDSITDVIFNIDVKNILPAYSNIKPTMIINNLNLPNKQLVVFKWKNDKKRGYPISFSTTNSNIYYKTNNINSYGIPKLYKKTLDPTGWEKVGYWFKKNGKVVGYVAGGVVIGAGGTYLLMK